MSEAKVVTVTATQLPLHCPTPEQALWDQHPRVFINVNTTGAARCPYCGTLYRLEGKKPAAGH